MWKFTMGTTSHKSRYFKKHLICQDCQLLARHWISCLPQTEMSSICWINAPFVHVFTAEVWTKSLVVCRQQLHKDSQKVSCSGLDRQEAKAFLSWKPISQHLCLSHNIPSNHIKTSEGEHLPAMLHRVNPLRQGIFLGRSHLCLVVLAFGIHHDSVGKRE